MKVAELGGYGKKPRIAAFRESCEAAGFEVVQVSRYGRQDFDPEAFDFVYTCGMHPAEETARLKCWRAGKHVVVVDLGYLKRASAEEHSGYHQIGLNRIGWVPEFLGECESRFEPLGMEVEPTGGRRGGSVLLLGQVMGDCQHPFRDASLFQQWLYRRAEFHGLPLDRLRWRPHPLARSCQRWEIVPVVADEESPGLDEALDAAAAVVCYNSTAGVEAVRRGIPVFCHEGAHFACVGGRRPLEERRAYFERLAWAQWNLAEIKRGDALRFLLERMPDEPVPDLPEAERGVRVKVVHRGGIREGEDYYACGEIAWLPEARVVALGDMVENA
jgi:hypothetical protein